MENTGLETLPYAINIGIAVIAAIIIMIAFVAVKITSEMMRARKINQPTTASNRTFSPTTALLILVALICAIGVWFFVVN